jgi:hypothetical protein
MRWPRVIVLLGTVFVAAAAPSAAPAAKRAGSAAGAGSLRLVLPHHTPRAGEVVQVGLVNQTSHPFLYSGCFVLQLRESHAWKTINGTHGMDNPCTWRDADPGGAHAHLEAGLVLYDDLQPGRYRITLLYKFLPKHWHTASLRDHHHELRAAVNVLEFDPGAAPHLTETQIKRIALATAARNGDPHPSLIQHAEGTRFEANRVASRDSNWVWNWSWAYLITIRGHFTGRCTATGPACANSPQNGHSYTYFNDHPIAAGSVLTIVINAKTGQLDDFGVSDHYPDLAKLGPVTTDYRH